MDQAPVTQVKHTSVTTLLGQALLRGDAVAIWRLPNTGEYHLLIARSVRKLETNDALEELPPGFMISPFLASESRLFLSADYYFRFQGQELQAPSTVLEANSQAWLSEQPRTSTPPRYFSQPATPTTITTDKEHFVALVDDAIAHICGGHAEKIVPSRRHEIQHQIDPLVAFEKLCQRYPTAMVSLISTPAHGTWLGATPETLVSIENDIFKTVALAGTKAWSEGTDLREVAWTQKEIEEQALVERYIISCFKKIRVREYDEHGPKTIVAGNLMHLMSDFKVDTKAINFPQLGSVMLGLLHPTSAVCGMPLEPALQFLQQREGYDRELYSGYIGPVNLQHTHLFVNLRCLQWRSDSVTFYAGAGVTIDSVSEREWDETEIKMQTLKAVIL